MTPCHPLTQPQGAQNAYQLSSLYCRYNKQYEELPCWGHSVWQIGHIHNKTIIYIRTHWNTQSSINAKNKTKQNPLKCWFSCVRAAVTQLSSLLSGPRNHRLNWASPCTVSSACYLSFCLCQPAVEGPPLLSTRDEAGPGLGSGSASRSSVFCRENAVTTS